MDNMMKPVITLQLTAGEVLMLQELTENMDAGYEWMRELAESLRKKALAAYKRPLLDPDDYADMLENERKMWQGEPIEAYMVRAKQKELDFLYEVEAY